MDFRFTVVQHGGCVVRIRMAVARVKTTTDQTHDTIGHLTFRSEEGATFCQLLAAGSRVLSAATVAGVDDTA